MSRALESGVWTVLSQQRPHSGLCSSSLDLPLEEQNRMYIEQKHQ